MSMPCSSERLKAPRPPPSPHLRFLPLRLLQPRCSGFHSVADKPRNSSKSDAVIATTIEATPDSVASGSGVRNRLHVGVGIPYADSVGAISRPRRGNHYHSAGSAPLEVPPRPVSAPSSPADGLQTARQRQPRHRPCRPLDAKRCGTVHATPVRVRGLRLLGRPWRRNGIEVHHRIALQRAGTIPRFAEAIDALTVSRTCDAPRIAFLLQPPWLRRRTWIGTSRREWCLHCRRRFRTSSIRPSDCP